MAVEEGLGAEAAEIGECGAQPRVIPIPPRQRDEARGHEGLLVSHQLPVLVTRLDAEDRSFVHDPRKRQCNLASLTSFTFEDNRFVALSYTEPAADLVARASKARGA